MTKTELNLRGIVERPGAYGLIEPPERLHGKVVAVVELREVVDKLGAGHLARHVLHVQVRVEQHQRARERVTRVCSARSRQVREINGSRQVSSAQVMSAQVSSDLVGQGSAMNGTRMSVARVCWGQGKVKLGNVRPEPVGTARNKCQPTGACRVTSVHEISAPPIARVPTMQSKTASLFILPCSENSTELRKQSLLA